jgi:hypothetical protein
MTGYVVPEVRSLKILSGKHDQSKEQRRIRYMKRISIGSLVVLLAGDGFEVALP